MGGDGGDRDNRGSGGCDSNVGDGDEVTGSIGGGGSSGGNDDSSVSGGSNVSGDDNCGIDGGN